MVMRLLTLVVIATLSGATPVLAQRRSPVPNSGMWAIGGSIGAGLPSDPSLSNGLNLTGNIERYVTPRISIRGQLGGEWSDIVNRGFAGTLSPVFVDGNVTYNWEGGIWHPYVTGGLGLYRYRSFESLAPTSVDNALGFDVGGGLEYFVNRHVTLTGEILFHEVGQVATPLATFSEGQFWTFTFGVKRYF
jgi:outer membrane protein with beta-barrel domain